MHRPLAAPSPRLALAAAAAAVLAACGTDPTSAPVTTGSGTWIDVPGMSCADGTATGIWISRGASENVLLLLSGGGACWADGRCPPSPYVLRRFGRQEFDAYFPSTQPGSVLDRAVAGNPFATWTHVFVPYCTGDVHAGASERTYGGAPWRHHGYANLQAAVARMAADLPRPPKVVVSGFSAGGFGALLALDLVHAAWDPGQATSLDATLVDDSGPTFVGTTEMPEALLGAWWDAWNLGSTLGSLCPGCASDLSRAWDVLHERHPADRLALLSTTADATMRSFLGTTSTASMPADTFTAGLDNLCAKLSAPAFETAAVQRAACFRVAGTGHALLGGPGYPPGPSYGTYTTTGGVSLLAWLGKLSSGDATWGPAGP